MKVIDMTRGDLFWTVVFALIFYEWLRWSFADVKADIKRRFRLRRENEEWKSANPEAVKYMLEHGLETKPLSDPWRWAVWLTVLAVIFIATPLVLAMLSGAWRK